MTFSYNDRFGQSIPRQATGNALNNTIDASEVSNYGNAYLELDGGLGADTLIGGHGHDTYVVDNVNDRVIETGVYSNGDQAARDDTVKSSISYSLGDNLENLILTGSAAIDGTGNNANNIIDGSSNSAINVLAGGKGDDTYYMGAGDIVLEAPGEGIDTVEVRTYAVGTYHLADFANVENLSLADSAGASNLIGNAFANTLTGNASTNFLDGGAGIDKLSGGAGNDTYIVDNVQDIVWEDADYWDNYSYRGYFGGTDTVRSTISYTLGNNVENLVLIGSDAVGGTGNSLNNTLDGSQNSAANVLAGGLGNDTYLLGTGDSVVETADGGTDTLISSVSTGLADNVENLTLTGSDAITATGNAGNNVLDGSQNTATNALIGGMGDDTYIVDSQDVLIENVGEGIDTVLAKTDYALGDNLENLTMTGYGGRLTGNHLNNVLTGSNYNTNILDGGAGADRLLGGGGSDTYIIDDAGDTIENEWSGWDTAISSISYALGNDLENLVLAGSADINGTGNNLDNRITGNAGVNVLAGGLGNDTYYVDALDSVVENANEGTDEVVSSISYALGANTENLSLQGTNAIDGTGNAGNNTIEGNAAANVLDGGVGADTLIGGNGDDTYIVDNASDKITELFGEGNDTVQSTVSYTLSANVENLTLLGNAASSGTGNGLDNIMIGNAAANTLKGGAGNDTYYVGAGDTVTENGGQGTDTVISSVTWTLGANLENLTLAGTAAINATGNTANNELTGNRGNNLLDGKGGADRLLGGAGNDTYVVDNGGDAVIENVGEGLDTVQSSVTYTLSENVENLTLTGTAASNGTGNQLDNVLTGNGAKNTLMGGVGDDILNGGGGADTMKGGVGNDTYVVDNTGDVVTENANEGTDAVKSSIAYTLGANLEKSLH